MSLPAGPRRPKLRLTSLVAFIPTRDADRARKFYERVVGLNFVQDDGFAVVMDFHGSMVRIAKVGEYQPFAFTLLGWDVGDIAAAARELTERGVAMERYSFLEQDAQGIWTAPGGHQIAWFKDPDGNLLSISQSPRRPGKASKRNEAKPKARRAIKSPRKKSVR